MKAAEFVQAYPLDIPPAQIHAGEYSKGIEDFQTFSYRFGRLLHNTLSDREADTFTDPQEMMQYRVHNETLFDREGDILLGGDTDLRAFSELNFHRMNGAMFGMWQPLLDGGWGSESNRLHRIRAAQRTLALESCTYFAARDIWINTQGGTHIIREGTDRQKELAGVINGTIQEMDAAYILLEFIRENPNLTIVPAPLNFERTRKRVNVDHVIVDVAGWRAVGAQVKTSTKSEEIEDADPERVVFIDGSVDLDNVLAMRTRKGSSSERVVPWAGLITTKAVSEMKVDKRASLERKRYERRLIDRAKSAVGDIKVDYSRIVKKVGSRILQKL